MTFSRGCTASFELAPISPRKSSASVYAPMSAWGPLSTTSPVTGSGNEYARPPRNGRRSRSVTRAPPRASRTAAARPAKPPPTTATCGGVTRDPSTALPREPVEDAEVRPDPGGDGEPCFLRARQPDLRSEDVVLPEHDAAEELLVDETHRLGGRERLPVLLGDQEARPPVVLACARALERHHLPERRRAVADEHVLLAAAEAAEVRTREIDASPACVLGDVAQDVRQLEGEPELGRVLPCRGVPVAEDLDADEADGARHAVAVRLEVAVPRLVALPVEVHLDPLDDRREVLAGDRVALDGVRERYADRVARPAGVDRVQLAAPAGEQRRRGVERPGAGGGVMSAGLVGDVVRGAAERVHRAERSPPVVGEEPEAPVEVRRRPAGERLAVVVRGGDRVADGDGGGGHIYASHTWRLDSDSRT